MTNQITIKELMDLFFDFTKKEKLFHKVIYNFYLKYPFEILNEEMIIGLFKFKRRAYNVQYLHEMNLYYMLWDFLENISPSSIEIRETYQIINSFTAYLKDRGYNKNVKII
jgi:hypothetical protein